MIKNIEEKGIDILTGLVQLDFFTALSATSSLLLKILSLGSILLIVGVFLRLPDFHIKIIYFVFIDLIGLYTIIIFSNYLKKDKLFILINLICYLVLNYRINDFSLFGPKGFILSLIVVYLNCFVIKHFAKNNLFFGYMIVLATSCLIRLIFNEILIIDIMHILIKHILFYFDQIIILSLFIFIGRFLWYKGIHGTNILTNLLMPLLLCATLYNLETYYTGTSVFYVFNIMFVQTWTIFGILPIVLFLKIFKIKKEVVNTSLKPALLNIGEPLIFGLPIVGNKTLLKPYLFCFMLNGLIPYILIKAGFIRANIFVLPYNIPGLFKIFLSTVDLNGIFLMSGLIVLNILIYALWKKDISD